MISPTVLAENSVRIPGLLAEHGLSYWIETGTHCVLFDTGQGMVLAQNARRLGIDLSKTDAIVLSHGHYDHVSGLPIALAAAPDAALWLHPRATEPKFSRSPNGKARRISTGFMERRLFAGRRTVHLVESPQEVVPGVWVTGEIPRWNGFEDVGGPFYLDEALTEPDPIADDMAIFLPGAERVSVIFGCAHAGIINTLEHIRSVASARQIHSLIGGLHLLAASELRMERTVAALHALAPRRLGFCHCTGDAAMRRLWREFPEICEDVHVGTQWKWE